MTTQEGMAEPVKADWHLDKRLTLGIIMALMFHGGTFLWWASKLDATVSQHSAFIKENKDNIATTRNYQYAIGSRLTKIEEGMKFQKEILVEIKEYQRERVNK